MVVAPFTCVTSTPAPSRQVLGVSAAGSTMLRRDQHRARDVDRHVGARLRERRVVLGLSQQQLAALLGVTFQQVFRYETGLNRLSAGRLPAIARALGVEVAYFFAGLERTPLTAPRRGQRQILELTRHFARLPHPLRKVLCELTRALADTPEGGEPERKERASTTV
jgi:transcriptional regulator with XRE-family HTH domain